MRPRALWEPNRAKIGLKSKRDNVPEGPLFTCGAGNKVDVAVTVGQDTHMLRKGAFDLPFVHVYPAPWLSEPTYHDATVTPSRLRLSSFAPILSYSELYTSYEAQHGLRRSLPPQTMFPSRRRKGCGGDCPQSFWFP